jgi:hypothetical protein
LLRGVMPVSSRTFATLLLGECRVTKRGGCPEGFHPLEITFSGGVTCLYGATKLKASMTLAPVTITFKKQELPLKSSLPSTGSYTSSSSEGTSLDRGPFAGPSLGCTM